jgi:tetratricopeptide (TPR) repeat protein
MGVGKLEAARQVYDEAYTLWQSFNNLPMLAENRANSVMLYLMIGDFEKGLEYSKEGYEISRRIGNEWGQVNSRIFVSMIHHAMGDIGSAIENLNAVTPEGDRVGHPGSIITRVQLAWVYASLGANEKAMIVAQQALQVSHSFLPFRAFALVCQAEMHLLQGDLPGAMRWLEEGVQIGFERLFLIIDAARMLVRAQIFISGKAYQEAITLIDAVLVSLGNAGARYFVPGARLVKASALAAAHRDEESLAVLLEARQAAQEIGFCSISWKIAANLALLSKELGKLPEVEMYQREAREIIAFIGEHTPDPDLRAGFLQLAEARLAGKRIPSDGKLPFLDWR